ncbi:MAG: permease [Galactobacter sp.]
MQGLERLRVALAEGAPTAGSAVGAVTPFCSCSTLPMLVGMLNAGVGFQTSMTYLISSPLLNPIIVGGIGIIFGWKIAIIYTVFTLVVSLLAPMIWTILGMQSAVKRVRVQGETTAEPWKGLAGELPGGATAGLG